MSYETTNYAVLAIPVSDIIEALPRGISFQLQKDGVFVMLDKKFARLCKTNLPGIFKHSKHASTKQIAADGFLEARGVSFTGPTCAFTGVIASAAGISDPTYFKEEFHLPINLKEGASDETIIYPGTIVEFIINGSAVKNAFIRIRFGAVLYSLVMALRSQKKLSVISSCDDGFSMKIACLKTALIRLYEGHKRKAEIQGYEVAYGYEYWMHFLIAAFLESRKFTDTHRIEVLSTYYGDPIDCGGMEKGEPYLSIGGLQAYDENGWDDPRKSKPDLVKEIKKLLLGGKTKKNFAKYTPEFGG